jgi:hypothetical protein
VQRRQSDVEIEGPTDRDTGIPGLPFCSGYILVSLRRTSTEWSVMTIELSLGYCSNEITVPGHGRVGDGRADQSMVL